MVIGDRHSFLASRLLPPFECLTQSPSYLQPIAALLYTDFDVFGFHRTASAQKQTTIQTLITAGLAL